MKNNKFLAFVALILAMSFAFGACDSSSSSKKHKKKNHKKKVEKVEDDDDDDDKDDKQKIDETEETEATEEDVVDETIPSETQVDTLVDDSKVIRLWSFSDEVPHFADKYKETHPDFGYEFEITIIATDNGGYQAALDNALAAGHDAPDIFCVESSFADKYINGEGSFYTNTYEDLGIDLDTMLKESEIAQYSVDVGTRVEDGKVIGLGYQSTSLGMIYRASIAEAVFGTSDPDEIAAIFGGGTNRWDDFLAAADTLKQNGYATVSSIDELWYSVQYSAPDKWVDGTTFTVSPERDEYIDLAMEMYSQSYTNGSIQWGQGWYEDTAGKGDREVFCYIEPAWFINYTLSLFCEDTYGDWRVCEAPISSYYGGTWLIPSRFTSSCSDEKKAAIAEFLTWVTLDSSDEGLQYLWASGAMNINNIPDTVTSNVVMKNLTQPLDILYGQNLFEPFIKANEKATGKNMSAYDAGFDIVWTDCIRQYLNGEITRDQVVKLFAEMIVETYAFNYSE